jgi:hypothetical protein
MAQGWVKLRVRERTGCISILRKGKERQSEFSEIISPAAKENHRPELRSLSFWVTNEFGRMLLDLTGGELGPLTPAFSPEGGVRGFCVLCG